MNSIEVQAPRKLCTVCGGKGTVTKSRANQGGDQPGSDRIYRMYPCHACTITAPQQGVK
jgi:hypothetical protein